MNSPVQVFSRGGWSGGPHELQHRVCSPIWRADSAANTPPRGLLARGWLTRIPGRCCRIHTFCREAKCLSRKCLFSIRVARALPVAGTVTWRLVAADAVARSTPHLSRPARAVAPAPECDDPLIRHPQCHAFGRRTASHVRFLRHGIDVRRSRYDAALLTCMCAAVRRRRQAAICQEGHFAGKTSPRKTAASVAHSYGRPRCRWWGSPVGGWLEERRSSSVAAVHRRLAGGSWASSCAGAVM